MHSLESVGQNLVPDKKLLSLMNTFRTMVNDCIRIGLEQHKTSMKSLSFATYPYLRKYKVKSYYRLCANSRASGILLNYRKLLKKGKKVKTPYCVKPLLTTCYQIKIKEGKLILPQDIIIPLKGYVLKRVCQEKTEIRSVTISTCNVNLCLAKEVSTIQCSGVLGIDMNYGNLTYADNLGNVKRLPMESLAETKLKYRENKHHFTRNDVRIRAKVFGKYGKLEADKTQSEIHKFTSRIVNHAKRNCQAVAMEDDIKDIRKLYRKGNGQGVNFRFKMNAWARGEVRRQLEYKGKREGLLVFTTSARGTSAKCSRCGSETSPEENRMLHCTYCGVQIDRDKNAAINIMKRGWEKLFSVRFRPIGLSSEAVRGNSMKELNTEIILGADGSHSSHLTGT
ncbi:MAG: transposase [Nitrososphaerales archaeon]